MLSIPACKSFELGIGNQAAASLGSSIQDIFYKDSENKIRTNTNHSGGILGGISNGMDIWGKIAFKPTSSIYKDQKTLSFQGNKTDLTIPNNARHDPCVGIRAVPVVRSMLALTLLDCLLMNQRNIINTEDIKELQRMI